MENESCLNFNENYNGKLWLKYFTTIRSFETIEEKDLKEGDNVQIQLNHFRILQAQIVSIYEIDLENLTDSQKTLLMVDCGCNWTQAADKITQLCRSNHVAVITLERKYTKPKK